MNTSQRIETDSVFSTFRLRDIPRLLWNVLRFPLLGILLLLEPVVRYTFSVAMVLGIITSVAFEISAAGPRFPFLAMLALSFGFGIALFLYYGLIALLSR
jgi:hypothetical protein